MGQNDIERKRGNIVNLRPKHEQFTTLSAKEGTN